MTALTMFQERTLERALEQDRINALARALQPDAIRAAAANEHAQFPQYVGRWRSEYGWVLAVAARGVAKYGVSMIRRGDVILARQRTGFPPDREWELYSVRSGSDWALSARHVGLLERGLS